jgi:flagellar biosynthetic protein FliR
LENINIFILVLVRCTGLFVIAPIFGRRNIPEYLKVGFSFFIALIIFNTQMPMKLDDISGVWGYTGIVLKEFTVGLTIGYAGYLVFAAMYIAGQIIDMQIGFGVVNVLDPVSNTQVPITANFYYTITMLLFMAMDGHHLLIRAICQSYTIVPLNTANFNNNLMNDILSVFGNIFIIALKIAAPVIAAIFLVAIALGIITKTVPQLNIFIVGMPMKIAMGLILMVITIPGFNMLVKTMIKGVDSEMLKFLTDLGTKP